MKNIYLEHNFSSFEEEMESNKSRTHSMEDSLMQAKRRLSAAEQSLESLKEELEQTPPEIVVYTETDTSLERSLSAAQIALEELRQTYTENNPIVIAQKAKVAALEEQVARKKESAEESSFSKVVTGINARFTSLSDSVRRTEGEIAALKSDIVNYEQHLNRLAQQRRELNELAP